MHIIVVNRGIFLNSGKSGRHIGKPCQTGIIKVLNLRSFSFRHVRKFVAGIVQDGITYRSTIGNQRL